MSLYVGFCCETSVLVARRCALGLVRLLNVGDVLEERQVRPGIHDPIEDGLERRPRSPGASAHATNVLTSAFVLLRDAGAREATALHSATLRLDMFCLLCLLLCLFGFVSPSSVESRTRRATFSG